VRETKVLYKAPLINIITRAEYKELIQNEISGEDYISIRIISESVAVHNLSTIRHKEIEKFGRHGPLRKGLFKIRSS